MPTLAGVGEDTGNQKLGPYLGVLKGVFTMVSSCSRKEGRTQGPGVAKEMGSGVGPECRAPLLEECPQHHAHKGDPGVTPRTCGAIGERAQVILVWVRALGR